MSDDLQKQQGVILCDMCTEEARKPARKTCMKCEISMCVQHLQAHLTTPVLLQTHPLTEPVFSCGSTKCPQHGKLLEYYCLDDMTCVCVSCAIEDQHRLHNMKTFSTAHKELMEKLNAEQEALLVKTDSENVSLDKWEKTEREKLVRSSLRLIEAVTNLRDIALTSVQSSVSARMVPIKTSKSSMLAVQNEKDTFRFLQMYSQVHQDLEKAKAVDLRKGLEPGSDRNKLVQEIRQNGEKMEKQAGLFWGSLLRLVDPENHQDVLDTSPDLIFDTQTLGPGMSLSKDNRKLFYCSQREKAVESYPQASGFSFGNSQAFRSVQSLSNIQRSISTLLICSTKSVQNLQRWTIRLSQDFDWVIGLCHKQSAKNIENGPAFGLCCKGNQLSSLKREYEDGCGETQPRVSSVLITCPDKMDEAVPRPEVVEVFWNSVDPSLSFFRRTGQHKKEEIITIQLRNNQDLAPFVHLKKENGQAVPQWSGRCSCGRTYNSYTHNGVCSCGARMGGACTIEVVCELM